MNDNPSERTTLWASLPLPKVSSLSLAQGYVDQGYTEKIEDVYIQLTPSQLRRRKRLLADVERRFAHSRAWRELPLPRRKAQPTRSRPRKIPVR